LDAALRAERIARTSLVLVARTLPERVALQYAAVRTQGLDLALSAVTGGEPPGPAAVRKVADAVVRSRAVILDELANRHRATIRTDDPGLLALAEEVAAGRARLAGWIHRGPGPLATGNYLERVEAARREQERREARLAARSESFRRLRTARRTGLADVVAALPDGSAILSYVVFDRHPVGWTDMAEQGEPAAVRETDRPEVVPWYVAFVLRPGDRAPRVLPIGTSAEVDRRVQEWRREVSHLPPAVTLGARPAMQRYDRTAEALRRTVWDPAQRDLSDVTRLFVVPDGSLHLVSYATLRAPSGEFLIECGPLLHRLTAEKDLVASSEQMAARALLVVGGVDFDSPLGPAPQGSSRQMVAETAEEPGAAAAAVYRGGQPPCREFQQLRFERLPGSAREVDDVVRFWRTRRGPSEQTASHEAVRVLRGPEAHEGILKRLAGRYRYLHLATHGFFLDSACRQGRTIADETRGVSHSTETGGAFTGNALLLSGLALAGANHRESVRDEQEDGVLTAAELASLDLSGVEAVVLSGCATGLGEVAPGEGVLGLQRAFRIAGARRVIMSLWNVQDQSAREWMRELYDVPRTGLGDATSVRRASRRVLQRRETEGRSTHPFFWGAFIASGY
jgi:CHAT domain-containing protein